MNAAARAGSGYSRAAPIATCHPHWDVFPANYKVTQKHSVEASTGSVPIVRVDMFEPDIYKVGRFPPYHRADDLSAKRFALRRSC